MQEGHLILGAGLLLTAGLVASLIAGRLRMPGLLLFLGIGMLAGSDGLGLIDFNDYEVARAVGIIALALILFEGGLTSGVLELRPILGSALSLALFGTLITAAVTGIAAAALFDLPLVEGLLLGSIVAATDGAAIFGLLRGSTLTRKLARTLEGEAGFNDPVAVFLVIGFTEWITHPGFGVLDMARLFGEEMAIGAAAGGLVGWLAVQAFRRVRLDSAGLYPVATLAAAAVAFGLADVLHGSGFLAVYLTGLLLGSTQIPAKRTIVSFHQGIAWVSQLGMFLVLGLLVYPSQLADVALRGTVLALVLCFLARPLATWLSTAFSPFTFAERTVLSWAGLRGAAPVVLATFAIVADVPDSLEFFNVVFFAVLFSTLLQGTTFEPLAKVLGITTNEPALPEPLAEAGVIRALGAEVLEFEIGADDAIVGHAVRDLGLPREANVNVIVRGDEAIPPRGATRLRAGDRLHVLMRQEEARAMPALVRRWREGPVGRPPRPPRALTGRRPIFTTRQWSAADGDPAHPTVVERVPVVEQLRIRRDVPGALAVLADGRYAVTGPLLMLGGREDLERYVRRRLRRTITDPEEAQWLTTVVSSLASDTPVAARRPEPAG